jgi:hypothetical protein
VLAKNIVPIISQKTISIELNICDISMDLKTTWVKIACSIYLTPTYIRVIIYPPLKSRNQVKL